MKGASRHSPLCNVVPVPDPEKLSDAFYFRAHALIDQVPKRRLLGLICGLERLVEACEAEGKGGSASPPQAAGSNHRALVVEDDPAMMEDVADVLIALGHEFDHARSLIEARRRAGTDHYAYVILDLEIPARSQRGKPRVRNGMNLLQELRKHPATQDLPIITINGQAKRGSDIAVWAVKEGAADYIEKPFPEDGYTLDSAIKKALAGNKAPAPTRKPPKAPKSKEPQEFEGGDMIFYEDRVELCGVWICGDSDSGMIRRILDRLGRRNERGRYVAYSGVALADFLGCDTGGNGVAGAVREFRQKVSGRLLEEANIRCGPRDVIESGGRGYRLNEKIAVCHQDGPQSDPKTDPRSEPNDPNTRVPDGDDDTQLTDRQRWAWAQLKAGKQLRNGDLVMKFGCSNSTATRDLSGLRRAKGIEFVGPARTGYWRLETEAEGASEKR